MGGAWVWVSAVCVLVGGARGFEKDMTVTVEAGATDCFYQHADLGTTIDIEYQVIDSGYGELDVTFQLTEPNGRVAVAEYKKREGSHRHSARLAGDYRFCFDNSFSTLSSKTVYFDLMIGDESEEATDYDDEKRLEFTDGAESYMLRAADISESVAKIKEHLETASRLQHAISAGEARDRNLAEEMNGRVLRTSLLHLFLILLIGAAQTLFVRNLFEAQSEWLVSLLRRLSS